MMRRQMRFARIAGVLKEWETATIAATLLSERSGMLTWIPAEKTPGNKAIRTFRDNLEKTYLIRLFAEFEVGLREAWEHSFKRTTEPRVRDLIDGLAALRRIPDPDIKRVHLTRLYRNAICPRRRRVRHPRPITDSKA